MGRLRAPPSALRASPGVYLVRLAGAEHGDFGGSVCEV